MPKSLNVVIKKALRDKGLEQLDVYKYPDKEIIRVRRLSDGKVFSIDIIGGRQSMKVEDCVAFVIKKVEELEKSKTKK